MSRGDRRPVDGLTVLFVLAAAVGVPAVVTLLYIVNGGTW